MDFVLLIVVVFASADGVATDSRTVEFESLSACNEAKVLVERGLLNLKGTLGREVYAECLKRR